MKSFEKGWKIFVVHTVEIVHNQTISTPSVEIVLTPYLEDDFEIFCGIVFTIVKF